MMYIDDISGKTGVRGTGKKRHVESEREKEGKKIGNDVSASGQLPWLLIKSADGRGGKGDRGVLKFAQGTAGN